MRRCPCCGNNRSDDPNDPEGFGRDKNLKDGLSWACRACNRERMAAHRERLGSVRKVPAKPTYFGVGPAVDLPVNEFCLGSARVHLRPKQAEMMTVVCNAYPKMAPNKDILFGMWGNCRPDTAGNAIRVHAGAIRSALAKSSEVLKRRVELLCVYGVGYRLILGSEGTGCEN